MQLAPACSHLRYNNHGVAGVLVCCTERFTNGSHHTGERSCSDWNNALKLGYDVYECTFPASMLRQEWSATLPQRILQPGDAIGRVSDAAAQRTGLPTSCEVVAGTTDSIAAFLASGASQVGDAVTSLGSTLAVKMLSKQPVEDASCGLYSHRLGAQHTPHCMHHTFSCLRQACMAACLQWDAPDPLSLRFSSGMPAQTKLMNPVSCVAACWPT